MKKMNLLFELLEASDITDDLSYCLRYGRDEVSHNLSGSLDRLGILNPLIAQTEIKGTRGKAWKFRLICGFSRLVWARQAGVGKLPVYVAEPDEMPDDLLMLAVEDHLEGRGLNVIEQAMAVSRMRNKKNIQWLLERFGYKASPGVIERLLGYLKLPEEIQASLAKGVISEGLVPYLREFSSDEQVELVNVIRDLKLSVGASRDLVRESLEICRRDAIAVSELLKTVGYEGIAENEHGKEAAGSDAAALREGVLSGVHQRRFPILTKLNKRYREAYRKLGLPNGFAIRAPKDFEGDRYTIEGRVRSAEELEKALESILLEMRRNRQSFEKVFDVKFEERT